MCCINASPYLLQCSETELAQNILGCARVPSAIPKSLTRSANITWYTKRITPIIPSGEISKEAAWQFGESLYKLPTCSG